MKRIIYLSFYFEPDLCAGSFRNTPLAIELSRQATLKNIIIDLYTTIPNRYSTFNTSADEFEQLGNLRIHRISLPPHKNGMLDQILSFKKFYLDVLKLNKNKSCDLVFASSSRLFTAYLGYKLAIKSKAILYLDVRDIFVDTMSSIFKSRILKFCILPILKFIESKVFKYAQHINLISGGFKEYFSQFNNSNFTFYTNGIDDEFLTDPIISIRGRDNSLKKKTIVYAGNIGEGQGLHKIIPQAAKELGNNYQFLIIGDGGIKWQLEEQIKKLSLSNVILQNPVKRNELQIIYRNSDYLFLHLNDYPAFRKVLPSKVFELATFRKPILAGVSGYAAHFIKSEIADSFVFNPCNVGELVCFLKNDELKSIIDRKDFKMKYRRSFINTEMSNSILSYL